MSELFVVLVRVGLYCTFYRQRTDNTYEAVV